MTRKKDATIGHIDIDTAFLAEFFPSDDSAVLHDFDEPSLVAVGRVICYTAAMGGMVTFYHSAHYECLGLSVRFGQRKRSFYLDGNDISATELVRFADGVARAYLAHLNSRGETQRPGEKAKKRQKKE